MAIQKPFAVIPIPLGTLSTPSSSFVSGRPITHVGEFKHISMITESTTTNPNIQGDFGSPQTVDFMAVIGVNATAATQVRLAMASTSTLLNTTPEFIGSLQLVRSPAITRDDGLYHAHYELSTPQTYRHWQVIGNNHTGNFRVAKIILGKRVNFASMYTKNYEFGVEDTGEINIGRFGISEETPGIIARRLGMTFEWLSQTDYETNWRPFTEKLGARGIAYWCFDSDPTIYRQSKSYLGYLQKPPAARGAVKPTNMAMDFDILSLI